MNDVAESIDIQIHELNRLLETTTDVNKKEQMTAAISSLQGRLDRVSKLGASTISCPFAASQFHDGRKERLFRASFQQKDIHSHHVINVASKQTPLLHHDASCRSRMANK